MVRFHDAKTGELLAEHQIYQGKGKKVSIPKNAARFKETRYDEIKTKVLIGFEGMLGAESYIERIMERFPRYIRDQLSIIGKAQDIYSKDELAKALNYCLERELYSANDFRDTLVYFNQEKPPQIIKSVELPMKYSSVRAHERNLDIYNALNEQSSILTGGDTV